MTADTAPLIGAAAAPAARPALTWAPWAGGLLAVGLLTAAVVQLSRVSSEALAMVRQLSPAFWVVFAALYLVQPLADHAIFRGLWRLPARAFGGILRKVAINEVLSGYTGELYFYLWTKRQAGLSDAPFGAIKDVNILSALGGNVLTLVMLALSATGLNQVDLTRQLGPALWPGLALVALSFGVLLFGRRVFSLSRHELVLVSVIHAVRLVVAGALTLLLWRMALPDVALGVWIVLMTSRLLLARLPFVANKDLVFANVVLILFGAGSPTALLLATVAIATLLIHLATIVLVGAPGFLRLVGSGFAAGGPRAHEQDSLPRAEIPR